MPTTTDAPRGSRLPYITLALAAAALLLGAYAAFGRPTPAPAAASECACDDRAIRRELDELRAGLAAVKAQNAPGPAAALALQSLAQRIAALEAGRPADAAAPAGSELPPSQRPNERRYVKLVAPNPAIAVKQMPDGSLSVRNTDPALTGTTMSVQAQTADGATETITVTVPAP